MTLQKEATVQQRYIAGLLGGDIYDVASDGAVGIARLSPDRRRRERFWVRPDGSFESGAWQLTADEKLLVKEREA